MHSRPCVQAESDTLIDERDALRAECRDLRRQNHALENDLERVGGMLVSMDAGLESCIAAAVLAAHPTPAQSEVLRAIRSHAAVLAVECMALMQLCACAVLPSSLLRVHVAALRPREAGSGAAAVDAVAPAICRIYNRSLMLQFGPAVLWLIGTTCHFLVLLDRFEPDSVQEWLMSSAAALTLPDIVLISATLNAKTVRTLSKGFETAYVTAYGLAVVMLFGFLFRERHAKMLAFALMTASFLVVGFLDALSEGARL